MQEDMNTRAEIIALLDARPEEFLLKIRQFILDLDELEDIEFLFPLDSEFARELDEHAVEAKAMLDNLREIDETLRDLDRGKMKIH